MQNDQTYSELIQNVETKEDFQILNNELDLLEASIFKVGKGSFDETLKNSVREPVARLISTLVASASGDKEEVIKKLREKISEIKFLELTLAFEPTRSVVDKISSWIKSSTPENVALDIKIDKSIIGGAVFSFKGRYLDLSVNKKFEEIIKNYV